MVAGDEWPLDDRNTDSYTYRSVSVIFFPLALWRAGVGVRSAGTSPCEVTLNPRNDRLGINDVTIQAIMNLGKVDVRGIVLGDGNGCVGVGNVATGAREVWICVGSKFGLDEAG